jgi:uncharacterized protein YjiS (DUF1127 family)
MEASMNDIPTRASAPHHALRPADMSRRHSSLVTLRSIFATWDERQRFRRELEQIARDNPHLIGDIGLTRRQVEAEIAKPFWQQ